MPGAADYWAFGAVQGLRVFFEETRDLHENLLHERQSCLDTLSAQVVDQTLLSTRPGVLDAGDTPVEYINLFCTCTAPR